MGLNKYFKIDGKTRELTKVTRKEWDEFQKLDHKRPFGKNSDLYFLVGGKDDEVHLVYWDGDSAWTEEGKTKMQPMFYPHEMRAFMLILAEAYAPKYVKKAIETWMLSEEL